MYCLANCVVSDYWSADDLKRATACFAKNFYSPHGNRDRAARCGRVGGETRSHFIGFQRLTAATQESCLCSTERVAGPLDQITFHYQTCLVIDCVQEDHDATLVLHPAIKNSVDSLQKSRC